MNSEGDAFLAGLVLGLVAAVILAAVLYDAGSSGVQQEAVDNGHAVYDGKTREFKWLPATNAEVP